MNELLESDTTADSSEDRSAENLEQAIVEFESNPQSLRLMRHLAIEYPHRFFIVAAKHLESETELPVHRFLARLMIRQQSLFENLVNPARCSSARAVALFKRLLAVDPTLDFKLARMLPGRNDSPHQNLLNGELAARAIDILDKTSPGQRLISLMGHLPNSADARISSKAALFVGRRTTNPVWIEKQLARDDNRLRANALEAIWGSKSDRSIRLLEECADDPSDRVAGNALIGLHMAGCKDVTERALGMSRSEKPGRRAAAAWVMGKIGNSVFIDRLVTLLRDDSPRVRSTVLRSLVKIARAESERLAAVVMTAEEKTAKTPEPELVEIVPESVPDENRTMDIDIKLDGSFKSRRR